jgi:hypothetical protein
MEINKNTFILNPKTNTYIFGNVDIRNKAYIGKFLNGEIRLRYGNHIGVNRGFGVMHIWEEHSKELEVMGYKAIEDVAHYISDIITLGAHVQYITRNTHAKSRLTVVGTSKGIAILEYQDDVESEGFYSVVTAYKKARPKGVLIGSVI